MVCSELWQTQRERAEGQVESCPMELPCRDMPLPPGWIRTEEEAWPPLRKLVVQGELGNRCPLNTSNFFRWACISQINIVLTFKPERIMGPLIRLDLGYEANFLYFILDLCSIHKGDDMNNNLENLSSTDTVHTGLFFMSHSLPLASRLPHLPYFLDLQMLGEFQKRSHFPNNLISKKKGSSIFWELKWLCFERP